MSELDDILAPARYRDSRCHTAQALEQVTDEEDRVKAAAAADNRNVPVENVRAYLTAKTGAAPKPQSVRRHRKRECSCP